MHSRQHATLNNSNQKKGWSPVSSAYSTKNISRKLAGNSSMMQRCKKKNSSLSKGSVCSETRTVGLPSTSFSKPNSVSKNSSYLASTRQSKTTMQAVNNKNFHKTSRQVQPSKSKGDVHLLREEFKIPILQLPNFPRKHKTGQNTPAGGDHIQTTSVTPSSKKQVVMKLHKPM